MSKVETLMFPLLIALSLIMGMIALFNDQSGAFVGLLAFSVILLLAWSDQ